MNNLEIKILWSEHSLLNRNSFEEYGKNAKVFKDFKDFDRELVYASRSTPNFGYAKCAFLAKAGKHEYEGRFDLHHYSCEQETSTGRISLAQWINDNVTYLKNHIKDYPSINKKELYFWLTLTKSSLGKQS